MSEIKRYEPELVDFNEFAMTQYPNGDWVTYEDHQAKIKELESQLEQAKKDQARYQWIRNESWAMYNYNKGRPHLVTFDSLQRPTHLAEDAVDQAVDAAMQEGK